MKKVIEYLKKRIVAINENNGSMTSFNPNDCCVISGNEAQKIIDFYELHKKESESMPNVPDITPEWDEIYHGFVYVAIDKNGDEYSYIYEPFHDERQWRTSGQWNKTGRVFDMAGIDWTKTLSKRP